MSKLVLIPLSIVAVVAALFCINNFTSEKSSDTTYVNEKSAIETESLENKEYKDSVEIYDIKHQKKIKVCSVDMDGKPSYFAPRRSDQGVDFSTKLSLKEIAESNIKGYVGEYRRVVKGNKRRNDGIVFCVEDNCFCIEKVASGGYTCRSLYSEYEYKDGFVKVVTPMDYELNWVGMYPFLGLEMDALMWIDLYSTEELLDFYGRLSSDVCEVDKDNATVMLNGYYFHGDKVDVLKDVAIVDCKNKRVYVKISENKFNVFEKKAHYTLENPSNKPMNDDSLKVMKTGKKSIWCKEFKMGTDGMWECEDKKFGVMTTVTHVDPKDPLDHAKKPQFILLAKDYSVKPSYEECEKKFKTGDLSEDYVVVSKDVTKYE
ncbi:hypothetical protein [Eubacterium xylanophilum]|uniref:hypothetical protein n=1 Tax=Eubacterium xylanophilum TaxID=39497 RepID=UPI00047B8E58|nr:hypothetical protein [Eubacterium xylanophilum]